jgi:hypothetical protein
LHKRDDGHVSNQMRKKLSDAKRQWSHWWQTRKNSNCEKRESKMCR